MANKLKIVVILAFVGVLAFVAYRFLFIRTVYYEISGIKIPSRYNVLTGTIKPIPNYQGRAIKKSIEDRTANKIGLTDEQVILAKFRWAVFEKWVAAHPEYKNWQSDPQVMKKANDQFRKEIESRGTRVKIIK